MPSTHLPISPSPVLHPPQKATMNLLPAKLGIAARADTNVYWRPRVYRPEKAPAQIPRLEGEEEGGEEEGEKEGGKSAEGEMLEATFRGRRLLGKEVVVPEGYSGYVFATTPAPSSGSEHPHPPPSGDLDDVDDFPQNMFTPLAQFDKMVIWGHDEFPTIEGAPGGGGGNGGDAVLRGVMEWVGLAGVIHGFGEEV